VPPIATHTPDEATVVLTVDLAVPPDSAYRAFTDPVVLARWFWPARLDAVYQLEPTVGGLWRARSEVLGIGFSAVYGEVSAGERLAMSWQWDDDEAISKVDLAFSPAAAGSTVRVTHSANPSVAAREEHRVGWTDCLGRLIAL
jgi:uncharacterized protein YndB with AHSA1/START domain